MAAGAISLWKISQGNSTFAPGLMRTGVLKSEIYNFISEFQYKIVAWTLSRRSSWAVLSSFYFGQIRRGRQYDGKSLKKEHARLHQDATKATTSGSVGLCGACMCGDGCMSRDGGFQAVLAAGENSQIRTL